MITASCLWIRSPARLGRNPAVKTTLELLLLLPGWPLTRRGKRVAASTLKERVVAVEEATIQATPLVSIQVQASRGTLGQATISVEQVPLAWPTADGDGDHERPPSLRMDGEARVQRVDPKCPPSAAIADRLREYVAEHLKRSDVGLHEC